MIEEGRYIATILSHALCMSQSGKMFVEVQLQIDEDVTTSKIWMTHKAANMAKLSLRACGFDIDTQELELLQVNHKLLAGKTVPVIIEENEYNGRTSLQCNIDSTPPLVKTDIQKMQDAMRKAKAKKNGREQEEPFEPTDEDIPF